jgi:hypothetical protein
MKITSMRRIAAALVAPALAVGTLALAPSAEAAPNSYAYSSARWLEDQLTGGLVHNGQYDFDDYGLSIDVFLALNELGTRPAAQSSIITALESHVADYTTYATNTYAGATAKLTVAAQAADEDPTAFGDVDLVAQLEELVVDNGSSAGRAEDAFEAGDPEGGDYSNSIGQSFAVRALAVAGSAEAADATSYLLKQQCDDGSFREAEADTQCTTDPGSVDVTAIALQALLVAKAQGQADLQDDIDQGVDHLLGAQAPNGSFTGNDTANTNTTGLAAATLKLVGQDGAAGSAAGWIIGHQVTDAVAEDTELAGELGAIAYDRSGFDAGKKAGITTGTRDQWVRATAQAAVGVQAQLAPATFTVTRPSGYAEAGSKVVIRATGLSAGEYATVGSFSKRADSTGSANLGYTAPAGTGTFTAVVTGSRSARTGSVDVKVLAAKKLTVKRSHTSVKAGKTQKVTVTGLASGEPVHVVYGGKTITTSKASSSGTFSYSFKVGSKKGKKSVSVIGAFDSRSGSTSFTVK